MAIERRRVGCADPFLGQQGYRVVAHDRRGHGRSEQTWAGNDYDTFADDFCGVVGKARPEGRDTGLQHHGCNLKPRCPPRREQRSRHAWNRNHENRHQKRHGIGLRPVCPQVSQVSWQSGAAMHRWARARASDQSAIDLGRKHRFNLAGPSRQHTAEKWSALLPMR
jgi:hypothetical protein